MRINNYSNKIISSKKTKLNQLKPLNIKKNILLVRKKRLGDIIMSLPVAKYFYNNDTNIFFATNKEYKNIFNYIDFPVKYNNLSYNKSNFDEIKNLDYNYSNNYQNIDSKIKILLATASVDISKLNIEDFIPKLTINSVNNLIQNKKNILISLDNASKCNRTMDINIIMPFIQKYNKYNFYFSSIFPHPIINKDHIFNMSSRTPSLSKFLELINNCDLIITVDTGTLHAAAALNKKIVAFFGATCPKFFTQHYKNIINIDFNKERNTYWDINNQNNYFSDLNFDFFEEIIEKAFNNSDNLIFDKNGNFLKKIN